MMMTANIRMLSKTETQVKTPRQQHWLLCLWPALCPDDCQYGCWTSTILLLTLPAGDLVRRLAGLLRVGVLRLCLSLGGEATRRRGGERGKRPLGEIGLKDACNSPVRAGCSLKRI